MSADEPPVHDSLTVLEYENVYRNEDWWKAAVRYQYEKSDSSEVAMYLWHRDDGWTQKNKYVAKTQEVWETDKSIVDSVLDGEAEKNASFPVSDYYSVAGGETVARDDDWWKAVVEIDQKGDYETREVVIYLWQSQSDSWRRRQKFTIKNRERWQEEAEVFESVLYDQQPSASTSSSGEDEEKLSIDGTDELTTLERELDEHLSTTLE